MKRKYVIMLALLAIAFISKAQTDTTAKLQDAQNLWATYNNGDPNDTTVFSALSADYTSVLGTDSLNARANQGLGDIYNMFAGYWQNKAQPLQSSNPGLYNTYIQQSNNYNALAAPYSQRYLRIKGISN
jgi:hypothetical protein